MRARFLVVLALLAASSARGQDSRAWHWNDTALQGAFAAELLGDYLQTRKIVRNRGVGTEANPVMGQDGKRLPPEVYFPAVFLLHTAGMRALPQPYRAIAQAMSVGVEGALVARNYRLGFSFRW